MNGRSAAECRDLIAAAAREGKTWIRAETRVIAYAELHGRIGAIAALATDRGLGIGDRIVVATRDDAEAALLFAALILNGLTAINLEPDTGVERAVALIARADPALMILDRDIAAKWALPGNRPLLEIVKPAAGKGLLGGLLKSRPQEGLAAELARVGFAASPAAIPAETLAYILFTSGTTREPKGVCISHRALFGHLATLSRVYGYDPASVILNTLMLSHADGMIQGPVIAFYNQATLQRPVSFAIGNIERLLDCVYQLRVTHMVAVPTMLALMVRLSRNQDDAFQGGEFRLLVSCGAALEPALWEAVEAKFGVSLINVYGLTETVVGGVFAGAVIDSRVPGSIGRPIDCELRIVDDAGQDADDGQPGELLMRGSLLMSGYFAAEELTREVIDGDGWLHTGDIAVRGANGLYAICGRKKNIVIRGGLNIHPEEVAEVLALHPAVRDALAFGVPDADWGERLVAIVAADAVAADDLLRFCSDRIEPRKVPSRILVVDALPKGRSGKIAIAAARALFDDADGIAAAAPAAGAVDAEARLIALAARCFRTDAARLTLASGPEDMVGWDSLAHMEFVVAVETEFGINLTPRQVIAIDSLGKALAFATQR